MFKKAERKSTKLKIALTGPSGSGKTMSALLLARGLGGKVAVIDTENGSASLYANMKEGPLAGFEFDTLELSPPFTPDKYVQAIESAEKGGYNVLVIDSITHAWAGEGGLLEQKAQLDSRPGSNSYTNWGPINKKENAFKNAWLHSTVHILSTMRSKQDYILEANDKGKQAPKKVGMAPVQRDGIEYEFTTVFDIAMNHEAEVSKDRTGLFADKIFKITPATGELFNEWLAGAVAASAAPKVEADEKTKATQQQTPPKAQTQPAQKETKTALPNMAPGAQKESAGNFIVPDGKYKNKKISEIDEATLTTWIEWGKDNPAKIEPYMKVVISKAKAFLLEKRPQ